jgi:hypothetical protein
MYLQNASSHATTTCYTRRLSQQSDEIKPLTEPCLRYLRTRLLNSTLHRETTTLCYAFQFRCYTFFITVHDVYFSVTLLLLQWPFLFRHYPASSVLRHCPTPYRASVGSRFVITCPILTLSFRDSVGSVGSPWVAVYSLYPTCHRLRPRRSNAALASMHCIIETSTYLTASSFSFTTFEAQSVQLSLTACCLDPSVLNLWNYSRRPKVLYPVTGLPCRNGTSARWNTRPCPAALNNLNIRISSSGLT